MWDEADSIDLELKNKIAGLWKAEAFELSELEPLLPQLAESLLRPSDEMPAGVSTAGQDETPEQPDDGDHRGFR